MFDFPTASLKIEEGNEKTEGSIFYDDDNDRHFNHFIFFVYLEKIH